MIEDGTPFCPHCGAPQIRVQVPEEVQPADTPAFVPGTPAEMQPPAQPVPLTAMPFPPQTSGFNWREAFPSIAIAGVLTGLASFLPLGVLWTVAGGFFAVFLYRRKHFGWPLTSGTGAKVGAVTGLIGYIIFSIVAAVDFTRPNSAMRQMLTQALQQAASRNNDPAVQDMYHKMNSPEGMAFLVVAMMIVLFVFFLGLGAAGGAMGASLTRRDRR